ncbi:MAG TPA: XdhC/CoxI family protein [Candidatus Wallbacteria bacterium]|nr:XdhC/CoxI family protein [Candidatus Wallbacteria bacterium]
MELNEIYNEISRLKSEGAAFTLVTVIESEGSTPRKIGSKMVVRPDGSIIGTIGGGPLEHEAAKKAVEALKKNECQRIRFDLAELLLSCGGSVEIFLEPHMSSARAIIFGGGHIAHKLAPLLRTLDFFVTVVDDRPEYLGQDRFPNCKTVEISGYEPADLSGSADLLKLSPADYMIIVTRGHEYSDGKVLNFILESLEEFAYIGMIGSRSKVAACMKELLEKGHPESKLKRVFAPIGLDLGGETPAEIAVSIAAEILNVKYASDGKHVSNKKGFFNN